MNSVFSLLSEEKAEEAKRRLLERISAGSDAEAFEIKWAEFDLKGRFLRAGISDVSDLSTYVIANSQSDTDIGRIARRAATGDLQAGMLEWLDEGKRFVWFVPFKPASADSVMETRLRGLLVSEPLFGEILDLFNADARLSMGEKRVVFQTVGGLDLRRAAELDGLAYETKRSHIKSANEKLGCSSQKDLVRLVVGQMAHLMSVSDSELAQSEAAAGFVARFLSNDMELIVTRSRDGRILRYLQGGPPDGTPVVMLHGMMFPITLSGVADHLWREGLRLIVPIRPGFLESRPLASLYQMPDIIESGIDDIATLLEMEDLAPAVLMGNSLGGVIAIHMAARYPDLISHLVLHSMNLARTKPSEQGQAGRFYEGMRALKDDPQMFKLANLEYRKYYASVSTCRDILHRHFGASQADLDVLEGEYTGYAAYAMFSDVYQTSIVGIAEDFGFVMSNWRDRISDLAMPVSIIHGTDDPLTDLSEFDGLEDSVAGCAIHPVDHAGHFSGVSHARQVWARIAAIAEDA